MTTLKDLPRGTAFTLTDSDVVWIVLVAATGRRWPLVATPYCPDKGQFNMCKMRPWMTVWLMQSPERTLWNQTRQWRELHRAARTESLMRECPDMAQYLQAERAFKARRHIKTLAILDKYLASNAAAEQFMEGVA